ncbi:MAG TPA: thiamine pyrophosphate-dependent enzyme [Candidatus Limnocylindria bacterium]|nr:thiamine pyrophosphate-dependent enzyme [Candidatus Limnocylindria bacterium]
MTLQEALGTIAPHLGDAVCIHSNGYMSRAAYGVRDTPRCFYMIGSMGLASSIGLGIALVRPAERVVVFDGDGNVLMNLSTLARIAAAAPRNLVHLCFDNGAHASTGGQATISNVVRLDEVARAAGYRWSGRVDDSQALAAAVPQVLAQDGPSFLLVKVELVAGAPPGPRVPHTPVEMTHRLRRALGAEP